MWPCSWTHSLKDVLVLTHREEEEANLTGDIMSPRLQRWLLRCRKLTYRSRKSRRCHIQKQGARFTQAGILQSLGLTTTPDSTIEFTIHQKKERKIDLKGVTRLKSYRCLVLFSRNLLISQWIYAKGFFVNRKSCVQIRWWIWRHLLTRREQRKVAAHHLLYSCPTSVVAALTVIN